MEELIKILSKVKPAVDYASEKSLIDGGILDSLELMELIGELEDRYDIEIGMAEITPDHFNSAEAICALVSRLQSRE